MGIGNPALHLVDSFDEAWEFSQWMEGRDWVAVDTETTGLGHDTDHVRLVQVGGLDAGWAMEWERWSGLFEDLVARRFDGAYILHNAPFDIGHMDKQRVRLDRSRVYDTRVASHILEPNFSTALKAQASRHVDFAAAGAQVELEKFINSRAAWTWATIPIETPQYWSYAALDTVLTGHLYAHHEPLAARYQAAVDLENAVQWTLHNMERHGMFVDLPYVHEQMRRFQEYQDKVAGWIQHEYGVKPGSLQACVKVLQDAGFKFNKATAAGAVSLDKEVLEGIDHPLAEALILYRQAQKMNSTYLRAFATRADSEGLVHPSINPLGARTSRMSISEPSLQNLPKKSDRNRFAEAVRNSVTTRYGDAGTLLMCDFDQIEMRLLAHMSGDQNLCDAFRAPEDFFVTIARQIYQDPSLVKADKRRSVTKNASYANIYGAGAEKQARMTGVAVDVIRDVKGRFDHLYPDVQRWKNEVDRLAWQRQKTEGIPYALSPVTGRRHVADVNKVYALVNYLIQGTAAEMFKQRLLALDAAGLGEFMVVPVHDEIVLDVPQDRVADVVDTLRDVMNDETSYRVPIRASVSIGQRWGTKEDLT